MSRRTMRERVEALAERYGFAGLEEHESGTGFYLIDGQGEFVCLRIVPLFNGYGYGIKVGFLSAWFRWLKENGADYHRAKALRAFQ